MSEQFDLTVPDQAKPGTDHYYIARLLLDWDGARIDVTLNSRGGISKTISYTGGTATALMKALNKINLSTKSLHRRLLEKFMADGDLSGTISGTPD